MRFSDRDGKQVTMNLPNRNRNAAHAIATRTRTLLVVLAVCLGAFAVLELVSCRRGAWTSPNSSVPVHTHIDHLMGLDTAGRCTYLPLNEAICVSQISLVNGSGPPLAPMYSLADQNVLPSDGSTTVEL